MSTRRIALVFEFSTLNGGERSMLAALEQLQKSKCDLEFVAIGPPVGRLADALSEHAIRLIGWSVHAESGQRRIAAEIDGSLITAIDSIQPDLVHANSLAMGRLLGRLAVKIPAPTTTHLRDIIRLSAATVADLNRNSRLIAVSNATREFHVRQGLDKHRTIIVHNGIDLERFRPHPPRGWLHRELSEHHRFDVDSNLTQIDQSFDNHSRTKLIACIGQIGLRKGQDVLARAAPMIVERVPNIQFLLIGERNSQKAESIEYERNIGRQFAEAGIANRLSRLGQRDDVPELLAEIDLLVHPANQEPFGRVLLEASASGVPIVATNVGGTSEIIEDGVTGRLVPPGNPQLLADAVIEVLTNDSEAQRMRIAARQRSEQLFSIETAAQRLAETWHETMSSQCNPA